jgi:pantoate--beta-alanine ligase
MNIFESAHEMREWSRAQREAGRSIGFVPTMGALHEGHLSLMRRASAENEVAVASIFVNPTQFAPTEDFDQYPRTWEADLEAARSVKTDAVYAPKASGMYPGGYATYVEVDQVSKGLCGASRPHFFRGVATVVTKLFHAVEPDRAYFGRKDAQQAAVIQRMVRDLDFPIDIVVCPIVREADGLAMSSRNRYLSPEERANALSLSQALRQAEALVGRGERNAERLRDTVRETLTGVKVDYIELVDPETIEPVRQVEGPALLAVAAWAGQTRLIDNTILSPEAPAPPPRE